MPTTGIASEAFSTRLSRTRSRSSCLARTVIGCVSSATLRMVPRPTALRRAGRILTMNPLRSSNWRLPVELAPTIEPLRVMLIARPSR